MDRMDSMFGTELAQATEHLKRFKHLKAVTCNCTAAGWKQALVKQECLDYFCYFHESAQMKAPGYQGQAQEEAKRQGYYYA